MLHGTRARLLAVFGPGLVVMLADSDVGSVITAGQSGVQWGYRLLGLQFLLIPFLYIVQELTVRLGIFTGRGHGELDPRRRSARSGPGCPSPASPSPRSARCSANLPASPELANSMDCRAWSRCRSPRSGCSPW